MSDKKRSFGFYFAWNGIRKVVRTERNFRVHLIIMIIVLLAGLYFKLLLIEWTIILFAIGLVLVTEMINSSIEKMVDYFKPEIHPSAKNIKDISAGAVLIAALTAVLVGLIIFIPKLL